MLIENKANVAVTGSFTSLNTKNMQGEVVSAASPPPILFRKYIPLPIVSKGSPLGINTKIEEYKKVFKIASGNRLFFHTYGIIRSLRQKMENKDKRKFHFNGVDDILLKYGKEPFENMVNHVWQDIMNMCYYKPVDDMLLIGIEVI